MEIVIALALSYILTGSWRIRQDFKQAYHDRPAYARNPSRYMLGFILILITWPIIVVNEALVHKSISKVVVPMAIFSVFLAFGVWLNS
jgi:Na+/alanine symporter